MIDDQSLSALDRRLLLEPDEYHSLEPFTDGTAELPDFHLYPSATAIVEAILDHVSAETADQVGIVLDEEAIYSSLSKPNSRPQRSFIRVGRDSSTTTRSDCSVDCSRRPSPVRD
ncbi:hypothetical protein [Halosimplex salinum]|uniref:hypothetical protein n=1 Tax=Halosimplex salinum TaxID=1710538 RepID=UPI0013DE1602|nr:hypothetical protein [Halosimplex salinum]